MHKFDKQSCIFITDYSFYWQQKKKYLFLNPLVGIHKFLVKEASEKVYKTPILCNKFYEISNRELLHKRRLFSVHIEAIHGKS